MLYCIALYYNCYTILYYTILYCTKMYKLGAVYEGSDRKEFIQGSRILATSHAHLRPRPPIATSNHAKSLLDPACPDLLKHAHSRNPASELLDPEIC